MSKPLLASVVFLLLSGPAAWAQADSVVGVGLSVSVSEATSPNADNHAGFGLVGRLRRGSGLGFSLGLGWYTSDVRTEAGGAVVPLGTMKIRPLMLGASYSWQFSRFALTAGVVGGWSFNEIRQTPAEQRAYAAALGLPDASASADNGWAVRPGLTVWYELGNRLAAATSIGYMINRPTVTTRGDGGQFRDRVNLSAVVVSFGIVYGVF